MTSWRPWMVVLMHVEVVCVLPCCDSDIQNVWSVRAIT